MLTDKLDLVWKSDSRSAPGKFDLPLVLPCFPAKSAYIARALQEQHGKNR
jgi:hypothetical protein